MWDLCARRGNPSTCGELEIHMLVRLTGYFTRWRGVLIVLPLLCRWRRSRISRWHINNKWLESQGHGFACSDAWPRRSFAIARSMGRHQEMPPRTDDRHILTLYIFLRAEIAPLLYTHYDLDTYFVYIWRFLHMRWRFYRDFVFYNFLCFFCWIYVLLSAWYMCDLPI